MTELPGSTMVRDAPLDRDGGVDEDVHSAALRYNGDRDEYEYVRCDGLRLSFTAAEYRRLLDTGLDMSELDGISVESLCTENDFSDGAT